MPKNRQAGLDAPAGQGPSASVAGAAVLRVLSQITGFEALDINDLMGCGYSELIPGLTPEQFVTHMLADYIDNQFGGKLVKVKPSTQRQKA